ncbi:MAG TPA: CHAT domain-containing tetratricopeptide repeat protein, partial [Pirellulales bacterium]
KDAQGEDAEAERLYQSALKLAEKHFGKEHRMPRMYRLLLGSLYVRAGRYDDAKPLFNQASWVLEAKGDPVVALDALNRLAAFHAAVGNADAAADEFDHARRLLRREAALVLIGLTAEEKARYLGDRDRAAFGAALSFAMANQQNAKVRELSAGWLANGKAAAQQDAADGAQVAGNDADPRVAVLAKQLRRLTAFLAALAAAPPTPGQEAARDRQVQALQKKAEGLEQEVRRARAQSSSASGWTEIADIRRALAADAVLIDIVKFKRQPPPAKESEAADSRYVAWIIPAAQRGEVRIVDLGEAKPIEAAIETCRAAASRPARAGDTAGEARQPLDALSRLLVKPLLPHVAAAKELVISPDAALWFVPWAALPVEADAKDVTFALEKWRIRFVTGGRDLVRPAAADAKPGASPCIFANPNYDLELADADANTRRLLGLSEADAKTTTAKKTAGTAKKTIGAANKTTPKDAVAKRGLASIGPAGRLPGTAAEAKATIPYLQQFAQLEPSAYVDGDALEGVFKQLHSPSALVLSTHGFFLPDEEPDDDRQLRALNLVMAAGQPTGRATVNPLLRCGLLLAACNQREQKAKTTLDDGVLTGLEIASADLRHTQLVVLSACETGVGDVTDGNSVACIRRAFQAAGARAVVATLWRIPDQETTWLMTRFWANLARGQTKAEALRDAQLMILRQHAELRQLAAKRHQGQLDAIVGLRGLKLGDNDAAAPAAVSAAGVAVSQRAHPFYWAAFTITGD